MQSLLEDMLNMIITGARAIIKIVSGFIIIPLGIAIDQIKPGWEEASKSVKVFTGIILIPITSFLYFAAPWWNDFDVID